jgi:geranylgeranyl diphosphate synthase, type II
MLTSVLERYLDECRALVMDEIQEIVPNNRFRPILYDLVLDYPLRSGKAFRPALCIATCRALGGRLEDVLHTAAVLELFHNAFLVHDDIEDGSLMRRGQPALHQDYGVPIAINVGDSIFALCLQPLLDNTRLLGLGKALHILQIIITMARESVEGQAMELDWIRQAEWRLRDRDYCLMCYKKSCWYTFIAPTQIGGVVSGVTEKLLSLLRKYAAYIGIAFQIQDDVLNLVADEQRYGKEIAGDLWEGKHTLILLHMLRTAPSEAACRARGLLAKDRLEKTEAEVAYLLDLIHACGSIDYARRVAHLMAQKAQRSLTSACEWMAPSVHRDFLAGMVEYVIERDR